MKKKEYEKPTIMALTLDPQRILSGSNQFATIESNNLDEWEAPETESSNGDVVHYK